MVQSFFWRESFVCTLEQPLMHVVELVNIVIFLQKKWEIETPLLPPSLQVETVASALEDELGVKFERIDSIEDSVFAEF